MEAGGQDEAPSREQGAELPAAGLRVEPRCKRGGDGCRSAAASSPVPPACSCGAAPALLAFVPKAPKGAAQRSTPPAAPLPGCKPAIPLDKSGEHAEISPGRI